MSTLAKMWLPVGAIGCLFAVATPAVPRASTPAPGAATVPAAAARPAAIVLVTVDTLRADRVSFDGYRFPTTPFLDRLASEGVVFERAYATSSWTPPTMASIFTGVPPMTHGVVSGEIVDNKAVRQSMLPQSLSTIAELVGRSGFRTMGVASNR
ncbi:MAG: sulfatase-like hydrolase/transferase, partial [Thermoanaerobaculia bacterium]|nr:sulfatase-like hydrolase/transferase [Thermoanaerobaculia bacterium]